MVTRIECSKLALENLQQIADYLHAAWYNEVARDFALRLYAKLKTLMSQPFIGTVFSVGPRVRSILISKHNRLYYRVKRKAMIIIMVFDTRPGSFQKPV